MKKLTTLLVALFMAFTVSAESKAITLDGHTFDFEDFNKSGSASITGRQQGFRWLHFATYSVPTTETGTGYDNALLSGRTELVSIPAYVNFQAITKDGGGTFSFTELWATATANNHNLNLHVQGFLNGVVKQECTVLLTTARPAYLNFEGTAFENIDRLVLTGLINGYAYGTPNSQGNALDYQFAIDGPSSPTPAPEPTSMVLGALGVAGLINRRRKQA